MSPYIEDASPETATPVQADWEVETILDQLTIDEKVSLLAGKDFWHTQNIPRLGIESIRLSDGPNGIRGTKFFGSVPSACLPCGTAIGATFDADLAVEIGRLQGDQARAKGAHVVLGPTINMQRGPLGGRGFESFSEDPVLSGIMAGNYCLGLQEKKIVPTLKHFVCNDMEHERMAVDVMVTERALREIYLRPFQIAIDMAQPGAIMTAYNKVNGVHAAEHSDLLESVLRKEWGWEGLVMSDWFGTYSTSEAINAGLDLEMPGPTRWRGAALTHAISANKVPEAALDDRVRAVLRLVKLASEAGIPQDAPEGELERPEDRALLRKVAADSLVLLKNEDNILPLRKDQRIAIIGPNAKIATYCGGGSASLNTYRSVTPFDGIEAQAQNGVDFAQGAYGHQMLPQLGAKLKTEDGRDGFVLRFFNDPAHIRKRVQLEERHLTDSNILFLDYDHPHLKPIWHAEATGFFTPEESGTYDLGLTVHGTGVLYVDGEPLIRNVEHQRGGSSFLGNGTVEETASLDLEAGRSYKISVQWGCAKTSTRKVPGTVDFGHGGLRIGGCKRLDLTEAIEAAAQLAKQSAQVVLFAGLSGEWESEGDDRANMDLPPGTDELITKVLDSNPNTVVVLQSGTPVAMPWADKAKAIVHAWYGGNETGHGIADVLFGDVNPSGKLSLTFPRRLKDTPCYLNYSSEAGRVLYGEDVYVGYRYYEQVEVEPVFRFGHGLSYTTFALSDLSLDMRSDSGRTLAVSCKLSNTGAVAGAEVVLAYVAPVASPIRRPVKELKAFKKTFVEAGQATSVEMEVDAIKATSFWCEKRKKWCSMRGKYRMLVGIGTRQELQECTFGMEKTVYWSGL